MGAFHGTGKRTGAIGSFLVGVYSEDDDAYQSCCKVATGFSDEDLKSLHAELTPSSRRSSRPRSRATTRRATMMAFDRTQDSILPFATLITRKRKDMRVEDVRVSVYLYLYLYAFACLLLNGEPLIKGLCARPSRPCVASSSSRTTKTRTRPRRSAST